VFIVVCSNTAVSKAVFDWIGGRNRPVGDSTVTVQGRLELFSNVVDGRWLHRPPTILVDAAELESGTLSPEFRRAAEQEIAEFRHEYARRFPGRSADDLGDAEVLREVMNTVGKPGKLGEQVRCVVSVSMLTEGWDANTVTHILGVRAFGTQLLCEQVVGRGLRRRSYVADDETGMFAPEYADVYGVPFQFIPTVAASREPTLKTTWHVRAEPDRTAKLEIAFPLVAGYHMEMPDAPLIADLSIPEARMVLSKADVPTETIVSGLVGEPDVHSLDDLRAVRSQRIAYRLAARVLENQLRSEEGDLRPWYFPQLLPIVRDWLRECLVLHDDTFPGMVLLQETEAAERIWQAISWQGGRRSRYVLPVLRSGDPVGSTTIVDFHTTREVYATREDRCPVNFVTLDGAGGNAWERSVAQALEALPEVASYVKNDHLDFAIPYEHAGRTWRFYPDFLVKLADRDDQTTRTLIVEVSGGRKSPSRTAQKAWAAREIWVPAVNNHGGFGVWGFCELHDPTRAKLDLAPAIDALYARRGVSGFTDSLTDDRGEPA
jgi:type III restriction enzyme